jgi:hypothetical protein
MVLGYNGRTDWADRADANGFFRGCVCLEFAKRFLRNDKKNPFQSARSAQSVLPLYPKTIGREVSLGNLFSNAAFNDWAINFPTPNMKILKILLNIVLMIVGMGCHSPGEVANLPVSVSVVPEINDVQTLKTNLKTAETVFGFNFNGNNGNPANVECEYLYDSGQLCGSATSPKQLDSQQIQELIAITTDTTTYNGSWSGLTGVCFVPHLGFAFFRHDSLVAQVNVCFLCSGIRTIPSYQSDGLTLVGAQQYKQLAQKLGLNVVNHSNATF